MCSNYLAPPLAAIYREKFRAEPPSGPGALHVWPGYEAGFVRKEADGQRVARLGRFGMVAPWVKELKQVRSTYNARSETVSEKPSFRNAWNKGQHCIIPAMSFFEPDWRTGKSVPTRIERRDGTPMGIAGLWDRWTSPDDELIYSFTMLTINATDHAVMNQFHRPEDEKRMVVILSEDQYETWLDAKPQESMDFMQAYPAEAMSAIATAENPQLF
ncbi:SOS response-associated peptidase [Leptospira sp. 96542]|nr:SOS response-associated peptidase [Leptospira sp. 96542]